MAARRPDVKGLPGATPAQAPGMHQYVVNLVPPDLGAKAPSRKEVARMNTQNSARVLEALRDLVREQKLESQVASFGEPSPLPVLTLTCTPAVAALAEKLPGVSDVYQDDDGSLAIVD